jgi:hypothetical protein
MPDIPSRIIDLIETFDRNIEAYRSPQYNETQLRREFIDPFFEELGWDVTNKSGCAPQYRDVIHEDAISVSGATKAPDYCFRIGGVRKFFLEAKKPSVNIKDAPHPAYQLRRYAWSAKLPLSILTDFEEFAVYDCRMRPKHTDSAATARIMFFNYKQYPEKWHEIADIFSKDAIWKGSFDKFAAAEKGKRGTTTVDTEFLAEIEDWRNKLARIIALRNRSLSMRELNFAVQQTIDRTLFLRMCEDRGIEPYGQLQSITPGDRTYPRLCEIFERADQRYNSGLFHFEDEPGREPPDKLTLNLIIDDVTLKWILRSLYYPQCPYVFSVLPPEILGNVYEQFLGKIISITPGRRAKIEEKPEVKKAGGVYYTPSYIVDYIVKNTVGKLTGDPTAGHCEEAEGRRSNLKSLTPKQIANLKILDPACGSGSFLLGAYTHLLNYHRDWYVANDPQKHTKQIYQGRAGDWFLTITEKKRILLNNIFGVDIDLQAVEVTKLSLLLKVLEGENSQTLENQYRLFHERALPDLANNIKCGNSLIGPDFFDNLEPEPRTASNIRCGGNNELRTMNNEQRTILDELRQKINAFDWEKEFAEIFSGKNPGFDAVISNPPWGAEFTDQELRYHRIKNKEIIVRMIDSFMYFVYQSCKRLNSSGFLGMILPDVILYQSDNLKLREYILQHFRIHALLNMGDVFHKVTRPASIIVIQQGNLSEHLITVSDLSLISKPDKELSLLRPANFKLFSQRQIEDLPSKLFITSHVDEYKLLNKLKTVSHRLLKQLVDQDGIQRGVSPDLKEAFIVPSSTISHAKLEKVKLRRVLTGGRQVKRFFIEHHNLWLIYTNHNEDFSKLPNICAYIDNFKDSITCKEVKQKKHPLHSLHRPREEKIFLKNKKLIGVITEDKIVIALDEAKTFTTDGLYVFSTKDDINEKYIMGILNSRLFVYIYRLLTLEKGRVLAQVKPTCLLQLPIRTIDFDNSDDKRQHDKMVKLVDRMLDLHKDLAAAKIPDEKTRIQREITATDSQIDRLVYNLYGLTEEEIKIIEQEA